MQRDPPKGGGLLGSMPCLEVIHRVLRLLSSAMTQRLANTKISHAIFHYHQRQACKGCGHLVTEEEVPGVAVKKEKIFEFAFVLTLY